MHGVVRYTGTLKSVLAFCVLAILAPLGCKLEAPMTFGDKCPPGKQIVKEGLPPHVILSNLRCYQDHFIVSDQSFNLGSLGDGNCCKESYDETGRIWQCSFLDECLDIYHDSLQLNLITDYVTCLNYRSSGWFEKKEEIVYSISCDSEDKCFDNEQHYGSCPESYSICSFNNDRGFFCISPCSSPFLTCPDEFSENQSGRNCVNPEKNIWHCGARGSCSEDSGENYKGAICKNGMICEKGDCVCPEPYKDCGGFCVDIDHDPKNCGGCAQDNQNYVCGSGQLCSEGKCVTDSCHNNTCSLSSCENSSAHCGPYCVNCDVLPNTIKVSCLSDEGRCTVSECEKGFHIAEDGATCEMNSSERCASQKSQEIKNCFEVFPNSGETYCDWDGKCWLKSCKSGFALVDDNKCLSDEDFCRAEDNQTFVNNQCRCNIGYSPCYVEKEELLSVFKCVNLLSDQENCGECSHACLGGSTCKQAQCQCDSHLAACYDESGENIIGCADLKTDSKHCGACNHSCPEGATCKEGKCQCDSDLNVCYDASGKNIIGCADFQSNSAHCGECNHACPSGAVCHEGQCQCDSDLTVCYDESGENIIGCADFQTDSSHCGECNHACPEGAICHEGQCHCESDLSICYDASGKNIIGCADFQTDSAHCGECNHSCSEGFICKDSKCQCETGYNECSDESDETIVRCVDFQTDSAHCGECNHPCSEGLTCKEGQCE